MPWDWSAAAQAALAGSHTAATRVEVWHGGSPSYVLEVVGGSVGCEADRAVRRNLSCSLVDPTGALSKGDVEDLLDPYECEIAPFRGVRLGSTDEVAPLGVFGLTSRSVKDAPDGLVINLSGQDRAMGYQGPMASSLAISAGTPVETAILRLLARRNPGLSMVAMKTGFTCGPLLFAPDIDVWKEAQDLAMSVGARLFHDRTGQATMALAGAPSDYPVATYEEGDGLLLDATRQEDSDTIKNVVIAESTNGLIKAVAKDIDVTSPTYAGGRYGERPVPLKSQHFASVDQAMQAATARLAYELGRSETASFTAVPDPGRDVEEVVTVHRPRAGLKYRALVTATLTIPLGVGEAMQVGARKSVLTQDGRIFPADVLTA